MPNKGYKHTPEARAKIAAAAKVREVSPESRAKIGRTLKGRFVGENHPSWKGGRTTVNGYVLLRRAGHPFADCNGYALEHRLIVEKAIGRYLKASEVVHHDNEDRADNRNKNLVACQDENYHRLLHRRARVIRKA